MNALAEVNAGNGILELLDKASQALEEAVERRGPGARIVSLHTLYYLPLALGLLGKPVERLSDVQDVLQQAEEMQDRGLAGLLAAEMLQALRSVDGWLSAPLTDADVRKWGVLLAEGQVPGMALLLGHASTASEAGVLIKALCKQGILCLLGNGVHTQVKDPPLGSLSGRNLVPLDGDGSSAVHAFGFAARCAMKLAGHRPGTSSEILDYCRHRVPGFTLALGELEQQERAIALGGLRFGFPLIDGRDSLDRPEELVRQCMARRGMRPAVHGVGVPPDYGPAFADERISDDNLHIQFGGGGCHAFELVQRAEPDQVKDGGIEIIGPPMPAQAQAKPMALGIIVRVAGRKIETDFETFLEKQVRDFINFTSGVRQAESEDGITIRISKAAAASGLGLEALGRIIHARFHEELGAAIEKVEITFVTEPGQHAAWLERYRAIHALRERRLAGITDDQVDVFFACTHCRAFAPCNVSIISPERASPCGRCTWLDARASYELNAPGARKPIAPGAPIDRQRGVWEGTNAYARTASRGRLHEVALYSLMDSPMSACADFECIVVLIPEANGVMVLAHEDTTLPTPAGLTIETFASLAAGGQIPGIVAMARSHLLSPRFIAPEGGFKRVVWMSSRLKESMYDDLKAVCAREGAPDLMDSIADERYAATPGQLVAWLKEHQHPALHMERLF